MPDAIAPPFAAMTPQRAATSAHPYGSINHLNDQLQPQHALPDEANQPDVLLLGASQSRSTINPVEVYIGTYTPHELPADLNVFAIHPEDPRAAFQDQYTHELDLNSVRHQELQYPPSSVTYEDRPSQVWHSGDDVMTAVNGSFPVQQDAFHWENAPQPYNDNTRALFDGDNGVMDRGYYQWQDGLCVVPQQYGTNRPPSTPEGATPFPSTLNQWRPQNQVSVSHYGGNSSSWEEPVPLRRQSEETAETQSTIQPTNGRQQTDDECESTGDEEKKALRVATSAVVEARRSALGRNIEKDTHRMLEKTGKQASRLNPSGLYFSGVIEARRAARRLDWPPREDPTLPNTEEERGAIVHELFAAIQDMRCIQDKKSGPMLRKRWLGDTSEGDNEDKHEGGDADEPRDTQKIAVDAVYKPEVKELLCWEVLETTERIYREGTRFVSILDPEVIKKCEKARNLTFTERIAKLVRVFKLYKSRMDKLLRGGVIEEYVLCPDTLLKTSSSNRTQNDERQKDLTAGRARPDRPDKKITKAKQIAASTPTHSRKRTRHDPEDATTGGELQAKRGRKA